MIATARPPWSQRRMTESARLIDRFIKWLSGLRAGARVFRRRILRPRSYLAITGCIDAVRRSLHEPPATFRSRGGIS
jgi:hypothetical protein